MLVQEYLIKIKNTTSDVKIKSKNHMMYWDIHNCICQKKRRFTIHYVKPTAQLLFKVDVQKLDQQTGSRWLIYETKRRKDNQLQSLKLSCRIA